MGAWYLYWIKLVSNLSFKIKMQIKIEEYKE